MNLEQIAADRDAAQRMSDTISLHIVAQDDIMDIYEKWVAFRLSDGTSDGVLYDSKADAVRHQLHETQCCYVKLMPGGMPFNEAVDVLRLNRWLYDNGLRLADPDKSYVSSYSFDEKRKILFGD